jgi:hypothetical protein
MRLHLRHPKGASAQAMKLWTEVCQIGCPIDVDDGSLTLLEEDTPLDSALAEAHVRLNAKGEVTHCVMRLSKAAVVAPSDDGLNTALHEAIHLRFLSGLFIARVKRADQIERDNRKCEGETPAQRTFESQRIALARYLYFFPDEVIAEKYFAQQYGSRVATRLTQYAGMQEVSWNDQEYAKWLEPLRAARSLNAAANAVSCASASCRLFALLAKPSR